MNKKTVFIFFAFLQFLFTPLALALDNTSENIFQETEQPESVEELSLKIESSLPHISSRDAADLAEAVYLIKELEREIFLTNQIIELREEDRDVEIPMPVITLPPRSEEIEESEISEIAEEPIEEIPEKGIEEIIVAKQVSELPELSLPREYKSLIKGLERKEKVRRAPVAPGEIRVYTREEIESHKLSVVIENEQTIFVPVVGLKRFMVTDPERLRAVREGEGIRITATKLGKAFLHVWDSKGRRTIKITVIQKGYQKILQAKKRALEATKMKSFKTKYSFDRYRLNSKSNNPDRSYHTTEWFHRLAISGETPWGMTNSRFQYEGEEPGGGAEDKSDLTAWDFNLRGDDIELSVGDTSASFSDITLPRTSYQGIRFKNPDEKEINYDLVWGVRGSRMWGYRVLDWTGSNYFWGARGQVEPADFIHFNATFLRALEDSEDIGEYLYATGMGLNFLEDAIEIEGEIARSKSEETDVHNHAYKLNAIARLEDYNLILEGTYRDIDPDYLSVTGGGIPNVGHLGYYFDADYRPFDYLWLTGEYNVFRNRYSFNINETQRYNWDWRTTVDLSIGDNTKFRSSFWRRNREGEATPVRSRGESYQLTHSLALPEPMKPVNIYFRYDPNKHKNLSDPTPNYREKRCTAGMGMNVMKNLYYDLQHTWHYRKMVASAESGTVKSLSTGLRYSSQILDTPFYGSLNFRYRKESDVMDNITLTSGENFVLGEGELKYRPSGDFETYLRVNYRRVRGILDHGRHREETRIYGGGSYLFDTTLRWGTGGSVMGFLFNDLNGNGRRDKDEGGMPGVNVYAGERNSTVTDADGRFEFKKIKGDEISVMFDTKMVPEGYKSTTPNPQTVKLERDFISEAYFGVIAASEISGIVFNDINMNGIFEDSDEGANKVLLSLDDGTVAQTTLSGHYRMEDVKAGTKALILDVTTFPPNLLPFATTKRTVEVREGQYYEEDFALYALRTIVGNVFIDANGNNEFDVGEEGAADVVLRCADAAAITDSQGRYFLKKLPGGRQEIILDMETIPDGYEFSAAPFRTIELLPGGEIRENENFALRKE